MKKMQEKLTMWQERLELAKQDFQPELNRMDRREAIVNGSHDILKPDGTVLKDKATHVRNVAFEIVETQVDSNIPQPKVTAVRQEDEHLAKIAEDLLRNILDRLPFERMNDEGERVCPTQGGYEFLVDWFDQAGGRGWMGDLKVSLLHPRKVIPQAGIDQVADMDHIFTLDAVTKAQVKRRYGVDVSDKNEEEPDVRGAGSQTQADELVTLVTAYYRNEKGGVGRFRWVADVPLEDMEDYQARRVKICRKCGTVGDGIRCRFCRGTAFDEELQEDEVLTGDLLLSDGTVIPAMSPARDEDGQIIYRDIAAPELETPVDGAAGGVLLDQMQPAGAMPTGIYTVRRQPVMEPTRLPYYKPDMFPVVLRKNVSKSGKFLGGSDIDAISDQQNALNKLSSKINRKVMGGGSVITKKRSMNLVVTDQDLVVAEVETPTDLECFQVRNLQVDIGNDIAWRGEVYEEARQTIGITDSMQGRKDPTATSKIAKEFSATQAAGRLESKRTMKNACFQDLFELMFKFFLAYADEPRPVVAYNEQGEVEYKTFDRHDFLYQDEAGSWQYNTDFLFSCDSSAPLASNREAMWQEARMNFQQGAYGPVNDLKALVRFWTIMETLHYPTAKMMKAELQRDLEEQRVRQEAMMRPQATMVPGAAAAVPGGADTGEGGMTV